MNKKPCACGSGLAYGECCGPYISGIKNAPTAEALMRSRYSAYAEHEIDYIIRTCTRDKEAEIDFKQTRKWSEESQWEGLEITGTTGGRDGDNEGTVEFVANYIMGGLREQHHEIASFVKTDGLWLYDNGKIIPKTIMRQGPKVGRNDPCPCGSGKKYKMCCGR